MLLTSTAVDLLVKWRIVFLKFIRSNGTICMKDRRRHKCKWSIFFNTATSSASVWQSSSENDREEAGFQFELSKTEPRVFLDVKLYFNHIYFLSDSTVKLSCYLSFTLSFLLFFISAFVWSALIVSFNNSQCLVPSLQLSSGYPIPLYPIV